jgi:predicted RNA-binding protein (virulence factor B family)
MGIISNSGFNITFAIMLKLGQYQTLNVLRETSVGMFLGNDDSEDILLPRKYTDGIPLDGSVEVFVYKDSEDRFVATIEKPLVTLGEFACLKVKDVAAVGAFLDWGLEKDLLLPFQEQTSPVEVGDWCVIFLKLDEKSDRLIATAKLREHLLNSSDTLTKGDEVEVMIWEESHLGLKVIVNRTYEGLIFFDDLFQEVAQGDVLQGYISMPRTDGKLNIRLGKPGHLNIEPNAQIILDKLIAEGGTLPFSDKSAPEKIIETFKMSKKSFKKALGALYKQKQITILEERITLVKPEDTTKS